MVVDLRSNLMYGLNAAGGCIWDALGEGTEPRSLALGLGLGGSALERALAPIEEFLAELRSAGLIESCVVRDSRECTTSRQQQIALELGPPAIIFRDEIRNFGQSANMICFQDPQCDQGCG